MRNKIDPVSSRAKVLDRHSCYQEQLVKYLIYVDILVSILLMIFFKVDISYGVFFVDYLLVQGGQFNFLVPKYD